MEYYSIPAADTTVLKDELIALVSVCLMREPAIPFVNNECKKEKEEEEEEEWEGEESQLENVEDEDNVKTVKRLDYQKESVTDKIRSLVHRISLHDGEFVLKLALYLRHELNLRKISNYLATLCAREPNCLPYLQCYLEKIIVLPSDWLAIANFAYFYDNDAAHNFIVKERKAANEEVLEKANKLLANTRHSKFSKSNKQDDAKPTKANKQNDAHNSKTNSTIKEIHMNNNSSKNKKKEQSKEKPSVDCYKPRIPHALRVALVSCFAKFNEFSLAKYNNESTERKHRKRAKRKNSKEMLNNASPTTSSTDDSSSTSSVLCSSSSDSSINTKAHSSNETDNSNTSTSVENEEPESVLAKLFEYSEPTGELTTTSISSSSRSSTASQSAPQYTNENSKQHSHTLQKEQILNSSSAHNNSSSSKRENNNKNNNNIYVKEGKSAASSVPSRHPRTFTYKQLVRMLHITQPAFAVCCLLGKRYPNTEEEFIRMGLNESIDNAAERKPQERRNANYNMKEENKEHEEETQESPIEEAAQELKSLRMRQFDPKLSGTRMKLPSISTWETQLSKEGNHGSVWDALVEKNELPFMASLRNLRNILTHNCCYDTHRTLLLRLQSEKEVALSRQLPFRFYSAYKAVGDVINDYKLTREWFHNKLETKRQFWREKYKSGTRRMMQKNNNNNTTTTFTAIRKSGRTSLMSVEKVPSIMEHKRYYHCEFPLLSEAEVQRWVKRYEFALNAAISIATKLNVIPMPGYSVVVLCLRNDLLMPLEVHGAGTVTSVRTRLDVIVLLAIMMKYMCEHCTILLACNTHYTEWNSFTFHEDGFLQNVEQLVELCQRMINGESSVVCTASASRIDKFDNITENNKVTNSKKSKVRLEKESFFNSDENNDSLDSDNNRREIHVQSQSNRINDKKNCCSFPFAFFDKVIEKEIKLEALLVIDMGHHTYDDDDSYIDDDNESNGDGSDLIDEKDKDSVGNFNDGTYTPKQKALWRNNVYHTMGDLPVYLSRLRRTCNQNLVYVGLSIAEQTHAKSRCQNVANDTKLELKTHTRSTLHSCDAQSVSSRFTHVNDILLSGFSEAVLRVIVERAHGGSRAVIERADSTYKVNKACNRLDANLREEQRRALQIITELEHAQQQKVLSLNTKVLSQEQEGEQSNIDSSSNNEHVYNMLDDSNSECRQVSSSSMDLTNSKENVKTSFITSISSPEHKHKEQLRRNAPTVTVHVPSSQTVDAAQKQLTSSHDPLKASLPEFNRPTLLKIKANEHADTWSAPKPFTFNWESIEQQRQHIMWNKEQDNNSLPSPVTSLMSNVETVTERKKGNKHGELNSHEGNDVPSRSSSKPLILHPTPFITLARATSDKEGAQHLRYALRSSSSSSNSNNNTQSRSNYTTKARLGANESHTVHHQHKKEMITRRRGVNSANVNLHNEEYKRTLEGTPLELTSEISIASRYEYNSSSSSSPSSSSAHSSSSYSCCSSCSSTYEQFSSSESESLELEKGMSSDAHSPNSASDTSTRLNYTSQQNHTYSPLLELQKEHDFHRTYSEQSEQESSERKGTSLQESNNHKVQFRTRNSKKNNVSAVPLHVSLPTYHECRFFISSTFLDMNNERSALVLDVFPRLRRWAAEVGLRINIVEVDLRWGITEWDTNENLSTSTCLNEVSRCAPFFVGMIGSRYGSCPNPLHIVVDEDVRMHDYDWLHELQNSNVSVTELEMRHGVYNACQRLQCTRPVTTVFLARDYDTLHNSLHSTSACARAVYTYESEEAKKRLSQLMHYLKEHNVNIISYTATYNSENAPCLPSAEITREHKGNNEAECKHTITPYNKRTMDMTSCHNNNNNNSSYGISTRLYSNTPSAASAIHNDANDNDDDLGKWSSSESASAALQRRFDAMKANSHILPSLPNTELDATNTSLATTSLLSWRPSDAKRTFLTSEDVPLDMRDFIDKSFHALQSVIARVCGLWPTQENNIHTVIHDKDKHLDHNKDYQYNTDMSAHVSNNNNSDKDMHSFVSAKAIKANEQVMLEKNEHREQSSRKSYSPSSASSSASSFYASIYYDLHSFMRELCQVYVPPHGLIERLASFALTGEFKVDEFYDKERNCFNFSHEQQVEKNKEFSSGGAVTLATEAVKTPRATGSLNSTGVATQETSNAFISSRLGLQLAPSSSNILVLEGGDGSGKSSAMATVARHLFALVPDHMHLVYYSMQAGSGSVRSFLLFLTLSLVLRVGLQDEFVIHEEDSVSTLFQQLPLIYQAIKQHKRSVIVLLDSLESSLEADELLKCLGLLVHTTAGPETRFIIATSYFSTFANALRTRIPPVLLLSIPQLGMSERAQLIRRHLALYGKKLQETMELNEISGLLHKRDAGNPNYLMAAVMYLRLFSTFDTLRADMRGMPSSIAELHRHLFKTLETKFDSETCRLVLTTLYLRQSAGGIMEYNLYRLVSNVAVATRLVALLMGSEITSRHGLLIIKNSSFASSIASTYLLRESDRVEAYGRMLAAELLHQPITQLWRLQSLLKTGVPLSSFSSSRFTPLYASQLAITPTPLLFGSAHSITSFTHSPRDESREALRLVMESITSHINASKRTMTDNNNDSCKQTFALNSSYSSSVTSEKNVSLFHLQPCMFNPVQYSPRELLGILQCAVQAKRADIAVTLVSYLPFLEVLLPAQGMLHRLLNLLIQASYESTQAARKVYPLLAFFKRKYHVLSIRPDLIRPCVLNASPSVCPISRWGMVQLAMLAHEQQEQQKQACICSNAHDVVEANIRNKNDEQLKDVTPTSNTSSAGAPKLSKQDSNRPLQGLTQSQNAITQKHIHSIEENYNSYHQHEKLKTVNGSIARNNSREYTFTLEHEGYKQDSTPQNVRSQRWVHWLNSSQHGGENREAIARPVTQKVLCIDINKTINLSYDFMSETGIAELALGCADGLIRLTSRASPEVISATLKHVNAVTALHFVPHHANLLVSGCASGLLYIWSLVDNTLVQVGIAHLRQISSIACHPRENVIVTGGLDSYCMMWKFIKSGNSSLEDALISHEANHSKEPWSSSTSEQISFSRSEANEMYKLRIKFGTIALDTSHLAFRPFHILRHHSSPVSGVAFHSSGEVLATASWDGMVYLINVTEFNDDDNNEEDEWDTAKSNKKTDVIDFSVPHVQSESDFVVTRSKKGLPYVHKVFKLTSPIRAVQFMPSLVITCAVGLYNGEITLLDYAGNQVQAVISNLHRQPITCLDYSHDGREVASGDESGIIKVSYAGVTGTQLCALNGHRGAITNVIFTINNNDANVTNYTFRNNSISKTFTDSSYLGSSIGNTTGIMNMMMRMRMEEPNSHSFLLPSNTGKDDNNSGDTICKVMSMGYDKTLQFWSVHETNSTQPTPSSHPAKVTSILFSSDCKMLLTGCASGLLIVFKRCNKSNKTNKSKNVASTTTMDDSSDSDSSDNDEEANEIINDDNEENISHSHQRNCTKSQWNTSAITLQTLKRIKQSMHCQNVCDNETDKEGTFTPTSTTTSTTTLYQPRFYMTHDHHRITSLAFALYNTRIVVGLANGHLYIWAASPGLNRREGRLLARVHVSLHGCYPVVALTCNELKANNATYLHSECNKCKSNTENNKNSKDEKGNTKYNCKSPSTSDECKQFNVVESHRVNNVKCNSKAKRANAAHVTALCSNAEMISFDLFDETVSLALLQRRRSNVSNINMNHETKHDIMQKDNNANNWKNGIQQEQHQQEEKQKYKNDSFVWQEDKANICTTHNTEHTKETTNNNSKSESNAENSNDGDDDDDDDDNDEITEQLVCVTRHVLQWLDLSEVETFDCHEKGKNNTKSNLINHTNINTIASYDKCNYKTWMLLPSSSPQSLQGVIKGEEVIALLQLSFLCTLKKMSFASQLTSSPPIFSLNITEHNFEEHSNNANSLTFPQMCSNWPLTLHGYGEETVSIDTNVGLLISHKHFYIACLHTHEVYAIPTRKTQSTILYTKEFTTEFSLHDEEVYDKVSALSWLPDNWDAETHKRVHVNCNNNDDSNSKYSTSRQNNVSVMDYSEWRHGIFAISTTIGRVYLFALAVHKSLISDTHSASQEKQQEKDSLLSSKVRVTFICEHEVKTYDEHASIVAVSALDLYLENYRHDGDMTPASSQSTCATTHKVNGNVMCKLHLFVGCKDGTTRVYLCPFLPCDVFLLENKYKRLQSSENNNRSKKQRRTTTQLLPNTKNEAHYHELEETCSFQEEGVFFATNELTTLSVRSMHHGSLPGQYDERVQWLQRESHNLYRPMWVVGDILGNVYQLMLEDVVSKFQISNSSHNTTKTQNAKDSNALVHYTPRRTTVTTNTEKQVAIVSPSIPFEDELSTDMSCVTIDAMRKLLECTNKHATMNTSLTLCKTGNSHRIMQTNLNCTDNQHHVGTCSKKGNISEMKNEEDDCNLRFNRYLQSVAAEFNIKIDNLVKLNNNYSIEEPNTTTRSLKEGTVKLTYLPTFESLHMCIAECDQDTGRNALYKLGQQHKLLSEELEQDEGSDPALNLSQSKLPSLPINKFQLNADVSHLFTLPLVSTLTTSASSASKHFSSKYNNHEHVHTTTDCNKHILQTRDNSANENNQNNVIDKQIANSASVNSEQVLSQSNSTHESYFDILTHERPTGAWTSSLEAKKAWLRKRNEVLKEAFRVQHYNSEARQALQHYNTKAINNFDLM